MALEFTVDAGFSELIIEGDNVNIMKAISSTQVDYSHLGHVHYNKSGLWWRNFSSQYVLISLPNTYGDEIAFITLALSHNVLMMKMFRHQ